MVTACHLWFLPELWDLLNASLTRCQATILTSIVCIWLVVFYFYWIEFGWLEFSRWKGWKKWEKKRRKDQKHSISYQSSNILSSCSFNILLLPKSSFSSSTLGKGHSHDIHNRSWWWQNALKARCRNIRPRNRVMRSTLRRSIRLFSEKNRVAVTSVHNWHDKKNALLVMTVNFRTDQTQ